MIYVNPGAPEKRNLSIIEEKIREHKN